MSNNKRLIYALVETPASNIPVLDTVLVDGKIRIVVNAEGAGGASASLTDAELRALPVPVSMTVPLGLTDTELRAQPVPVSMTIPVGLTDAQLRATAVPVSGTVVTGGLTDAQVRATPLPVSTTDATATGTITTQNLVPTGTATAGSALEVSTVGKCTLAVQVEGTYTGVLSVQARVAASGLWVTLTHPTILLRDTGVYSATILSAATGLWQLDVAGYSAVRITALAAVTGTATVNIRATEQTGIVGVKSLPAGSQIIGALVANQSVNKAQINGVAPLMGNGVTGTGSQRVTVASDNTAFNVINTPVTPTSNMLSSAASTNATSVKASAGTVWSVTVSNIGGAAAFLKLYNLAVAPTVGTSVPVLTVAVPASGTVVVGGGSNGIRFSTGIALAITNLAADSDATAVAAAQVKVITTYT